MKRGAPGPAGCLPPPVLLHSSSALNLELWCTVPRFARCAVRQCARHGTSPSLSGCAPVARLRALGKHFRSSFDSSVGCCLAPPVQLGGEEETLGLSLGEWRGWTRSLGGRERGGVGGWSEQRNRCNGRRLLCCSESGLGGGGNVSGEVHSVVVRRVMGVSM